MSGFIAKTRSYLNCKTKQFLATFWLIVETHFLILIIMVYGIENLFEYKMKKAKTCYNTIKIQIPYNVVRVKLIKLSF